MSTVDLKEIKSLVEMQGDAFASFKNAMDAKLDAERKEREALEARLNRGGIAANFDFGEAKSAMIEIGEAFRGFIKSGDKSGFVDLTRKGMMVGSDPDGGYSVIPEFSRQITRTLKEISPMRRLANIRAISTDALEEIYDRDSAGAEWVAETGARPATTSPQIGKWRIPVNEIYANPLISQQLLDDSALDLGTWLVGKIAVSFAEKEGSAFVKGDGVGKPRGIISYDAVTTGDSTREWGKLQYVASGLSGGFLADANKPADKLIDLVAELKSGYRFNARWLMNRRTAAAISKMKDTTNNYIWQRSMAAGQPDSLLGYPVELDEEMPDMAANSYSVAFGDFRSGYTIVDRIGTRVLRDPYTSKPYVSFYTYGRVGGDVTNFEAIKLMKFSVS
jgi:HK97 family phage major capsid protein